jgi:hypothetical protein
LTATRESCEWIYGQVSVHLSCERNITIERTLCTKQKGRAPGAVPASGGWPHSNSEKRPWVAHPCGFCKGGLFLLSLSNSHASSLGKQMGPDDTDKFAGADDFGFLPELWEVALIAGDQVVRSGVVGAFKENVIGGIGSDLQRR